MIAEQSMKQIVFLHIIMLMNVFHNIPPVFDEQSKVLILGSFPSVKSREGGFFYHHRQNRFWKVMEALFGYELDSIEDKKEFLHKEHIALWDVVHSCRIEGSSDSSITDVVANDLSLIFSSSDIKAVYTNGKRAFGLYMKYCYPSSGIEPIPLPSTSPANASWPFKRLLDAWSVVRSEVCS